MSIMFADIRSFTSLAEQLGAAKTFAFLNDYYGRVGEVIRAHGGFIDKYLFNPSRKTLLHLSHFVQFVVSSVHCNKPFGMCVNERTVFISWRTISSEYQRD